VIPTSAPETLDAGLMLARHQHRSAYATIVLEGAYEEAGDAGRIAAQAGDVLLHAPFSAHLDRVGRRTARVLDLPLDDGDAPSFARARLADADLLVRIAERDAREAAKGLLEAIEPRDDDRRNAADALAAALRRPPPPRIAHWAANTGRSREALSRQFRSIYGISAAQYRLEAMARRAWSEVVGGTASLAEIACATGFADQAHMTRAVARLTGAPPGAWRKQRAN
jgi:AraC-like DNA-binding protein